jgi:cathepsin B
MIALKFLTSFIFFHYILTQNDIPITPQYLEELRQKSQFQIFNYEEHPFKNWSLNDLQSLLSNDDDEEGDTTDIDSQIYYGQVNSELPKAFDVREKWPKCIHPIREQKKCGSCWAHAASEVLSDRFCIASGGAVDTVLSPQDLVSCDSKNHGCHGGGPKNTWTYLHEVGIVTEECLPYKANGGECPFTDGKQECQSGAFRKYKAKNFHKFNYITKAKEAIIKNGPIQAAFDVFHDFFSYKGGVYRATKKKRVGRHVIKLIGWGTSDDGSEYWVAANSWGTKWGEDGFFKIAFGECRIEERMWSGFPELGL